MKTEREILLHRYLDGTITPEEMSELNAMLEESADWRNEFAALLNLDAALGQMAAGWQAGITEDSTTLPRTHRFPVGARWLAVAAAVALAGGVVLFWQAVDRPYAVVEKSSGAAGLGDREESRGEKRTIPSGTVKLRTLRGAEVVIEAPATFRFESPERLRLFIGRLAADVPPEAKGFTVVTPDGDAVDLGTRFGVDVPDSGNSEIHVFEGEVIASGIGSNRSLRTGEALTMSRGSGDVRALRSAAFIHSDELPALTAGLQAGQEARAKVATDSLRNDASLIELIEFGEASRRPGIYRIVQGRWPGSRAAEFVEVGDHLRLDRGGSESRPQLTLAAWVRLDRLGAPYQSLLHTDGWSEEKPGQVHWMINGDATMRLALRGNMLAPGSDEQHGFPDSNTPVLPERGRWVHLAVVYDSDAGTVRFYLNGRFDKETRQSVAHVARLGPAQIGNWDQQDRKLSGRIDELIILGRAMSDAEIHELHESGTPYR